MAIDTSSRLGNIDTPSTEFNVEEITKLSLFGNGLPIDSNVFLPITIILPVVYFLK